MTDFPKKLKPLLYYEDNQIAFIGSLDDNFFIKVSPIMKDFLKVCERLNTEELNHYLINRYPENIVRLFYKKLDTYKRYLFKETKEKNVDPFNFKRTITTVTLNLSHACNLKCTYCFEGLEFRHNSRMMRSDIALKAVERFIDQLGSEKGTIIFTGGEPLVNFPVIKDVVNFVKTKEKNIEFFIKTNATLMTDEVMDFLISNGFLIQISIDGCREAHDFHRRTVDGRATFDTVERAIQSLLSRGYGHHVILNGTVTHQTIELLEESYEYFKCFKGIRSFFIKPVMGSNDQNFVLSDEDYRIYERSLFSLARERFFSEERNNMAYDKLEGICGIGVWHIAVDVDGKIYPCYRLSGMDDFAMGDIFQSALSHLIIPDALVNLYNIDLDNKCSECFGKVFCRKGCYADKLLSSPSNLCACVERRFGEYFIIENLKNTHMMLPLI